MMTNLVQTVVLIFAVVAVHYAAAEGPSGESEHLNLDLRESSVVKRQESCVDNYDDCAYWASIGECERNWSFMIPDCRKSCDACTGCFDKHADCAKWASKNECSNNVRWMIPECEKSCDSCWNTNVCEDKTGQCAKWASEDKCDKDPVFMYRYCQKSCNLCECKDKSNDCQTLMRKGDCIKNKPWMDANCPLSCATCAGKCLDAIGEDAHYNDIDCRVYSRCGYCTNQAVTFSESVRGRCPKSCAICNSNPIATAPATCGDWLDEETCLDVVTDGNCGMPTYNMGCMKTCGGCAWLAAKTEGQCAFEDCDTWAQQGYCTGDGDPCFMDTFCGPACNGGGCQSYSKPIPIGK